MFPSDIIPPYIDSLSPYVPGRLIEDAVKELGLTKVIKLASNENNLGPSPMVLKAITEALPGIYRYGDPASQQLKKAIAKKLDLPPEYIICANGSSEFILVLAHAILRPGLGAVMSKPSFTLYHLNAAASGAEITEIGLKDYKHDLLAIKKAINENTRLVFLDNPINPTGGWLTKESLREFVEDLPPKCLLLLDEAYVDFARSPRPDYKELLSGGQVIILRTFSKLYGMAGLRAGYALMDPILSEAINKIRQPFNINLLAQIGALAALKDDSYAQETKKNVWKMLDVLYLELPKLGLQTHPTEANFLMVGTGNMPAQDFYTGLFKEGVIIRSLTSFGLFDKVRISVGIHPEILSLIEASKKVLKFS
ncbi:MAG: histidinol-phosphate transaminase [Deltaproteobacteria bacterium]|jgi:histidinol-phosphate aminotransferase|nr:histidinol-phosphate transaminase [Deltaproteobacteria bacterium]